ncbi:MAG: alpha/beta fold hydrolase [Pseudomonadota bacterium]
MNEHQTIIRIASGQLVRLRLMGQGPAVVLCHESPRSSAALLPLAGRLADRFTCVMIDTPGFGLSDPMPQARPEIEEFAGVVIEVIDALGLAPVPVYGTHTGAAIAIEAAIQAPEKVAAAILDGYALFTPDEQAELLASYLPPFRPTLDGTHVAWLWARVRDQFTAFPWNRVSDGARLPFGPPPLAFHQAVVEDFLLAGDSYRVGYAAAFRYDHLAPLSRARVPVRLGTRLDDLLHPHMARAAAGAGPHVTIQDFPADRDLWGGDLAALFAQHAKGAQMNAEVLLSRAAAHQGGRQIVNTDQGAIVARIEGRGPPLVLLHDVPGGMADLDHIAQRLARHRRVIRINLPGLGASRLAVDASAGADTLVNGTRAALAALGVADAPVLAYGASLPVALGATTGPLIALDPWPQVAQDLADALPDLTPRWDGGHLTAAFWWARDYALFKPWFNRVNAHGRSIGAERDAERINHRFRACSLAGTTGTAIARALYEQACSGMLRDRDSRVLYYSADPDAEALHSWSVGAVGEDRVLGVPREAPALAAAILRCLA